MKTIVTRVTQGWRTGTIVCVEDNSNEILQKFPGGVYKLIDVGGMGGYVPGFEPYSLTERYNISKDGITNQTLLALLRFFSNPIADKHKDLGIKHKTSFIFHGPPGTGKTVSANIIMQALAEKVGAVSVIIPAGTRPDLWLNAMRALSRLKLPIVFFLDECDEELTQHEPRWLVALDGAESIDNFVLMGCTNHLDKISRRLRRPSRLENFILFEGIEAEIAKAYVDDKLKHIDKGIRDGIAYIAHDEKVTMDVFKHAVKDFYINSESLALDDFKRSLAHYKKTQDT